MDEGGDRLDVFPVHFRVDPAFNMQLHPGGDNQQFDRFAPAVRWRPAMVDDFEVLDGAFGFDMNAVRGEDPAGAAGVDDVLDASNNVVVGNANFEDNAHAAGRIAAHVVSDRAPVEDVVKEIDPPIPGENPASLEKEAKDKELEEDDSFQWWDEFADSDSDFTSDSV